MLITYNLITWHLSLAAWPATGHRDFEYYDHFDEMVSTSAIILLAFSLRLKLAWSHTHSSFEEWELAVL